MPAIIAAVKSIEDETKINKYKYLGWEHGAEIYFVDTQCSSAIGPLAAFYYYIRSKVDVFLGPVCPYVLAPVARYTSYWDIPHLTSSGQVSMFDDKNSTFRILTRMNGSFSRMGQFFNQILQRFNWKTVFFLYTDHNDRSKGHSLCYFSLASVFMSMGPKAVELKRSFDEEQEYAYEDYLQDASMKSRIIIMCAKKETVRKIMIAAYRLQMIQTGEYVFINVELTTGLDAAQRPWEREDDTPENNSIAKEAYTALIRVTPKMPQTSTINSFLESVQKIARDEFNINYGREEVSTYVTAFHEAVHVYALGLNDTLSEGHHVINGTMITRKIWNRTFTGIAGNVTIDSNGDRLVDYTLFDMNPITGDFEAVMIFDSLAQQFFEVEGKKIHWPNNREGPPPDTPPCGFEGELCLAEAELRSQLVLIITAIVLSFLLLFLFVVFILVYRHYRLEAELASMTWKIRCDDIVMPSSDMMYMAKIGSRMSLARTSLSSDTMPLMNGTKTICGQNSFPRNGIYRGVLVALKPIEKQRIELTRSLLIELKNMKNLQHNHLVTFIGACIDQPHATFLVTEYCPKGSLQDILENDEIKLDWMFRYSLMHDIIKGMAYLHSSEMHVHGNLKSTNCVVDSRFVLKITDFGLHSLRQQDYTPTNRSPMLPHNVDDTHYAYWRKKLWTAPELLRLWLKSSECNGNKQIQQLHSQFIHGTQKGDVYSFAIILHEIILRQGVFYLGEDDKKSPRDIIYQLANYDDENDNNNNNNGEHLRPLLEEHMADEAVLQMVRRCWHEDPNERPDFVTLQSIIRRINKENESSNILDNLLKRMEQYATNLESLVQERTADYLEEKRKAEDLLYQLLPKSVASQLISGESVRAEAYDSVTIYFSDIVGFTNISAQSTPMQVVNLLNDLYTCFDSILENFDVYKVETIGDAYMVVSGVPVRNGERHGREIARMSLALLHAVRSFKIRHRPGEQLMLRIGIHTGSCAAGVVGLKMPRYCLFGDTVNTASRMESTGQALKIHVSSNTKALLDKFVEFDLVLRGEIDVKGKGKMTTYWLQGMKKNNHLNESTSDVETCSELDCIRVLDTGDISSYSEIRSQNSQSGSHYELQQSKQPTLTQQDSSINIPSELTNPSKIE
uniref:Guanylate cyclase n=1 Tax=Dermatophagoides pteronyssinus TaxID=6956 RepID=A0A6P6XS54_DERPT|nr:atrial natriuretic peptide receptor 1-like [Dermatophagoides pteronyssinus]